MFRSPHSARCATEKPRQTPSEAVLVIVGLGRCCGSPGDEVAQRAGLHSLLAEAGQDVGDGATTADGAVCLAMAATRHGSRLVQVSSDAICSGSDVRYDESATPDPVTPYGAAKAAAEMAIRLFAPDAVIARTSLITGGEFLRRER